MTKALAKYNQSKIGLIYEKLLEFQEIFLKENDEIMVYGEVNRFEIRKPIFRHQSQPLMVYEISKLQATKKVKFKLSAIIIALIVIPVVEGYLVINYAL